MRTFSFCLQLWMDSSQSDNMLSASLFLPQLQFCSLSRQTDLDQPFQQLDELVLLPGANKTESVVYTFREKRIGTLSTQSSWTRLILYLRF